MLFSLWFAVCGFASDAKMPLMSARQFYVALQSFATGNSVFRYEVKEGLFVYYEIIKIVVRFARV